MKAEPSGLIPRKPAANLELLIVDEKSNPNRFEINHE